MVLTFVAVAVASLFLAFMVASTLYLDEFRGIVQENLIASGKKMIGTYRETPSVELVPFMQKVADLSNIAVQLYDGDGRPLLHGPSGTPGIDPSAVRRVLAGGIERDAGHDPITRVGIPFEADGQRYALFLMPVTNALEQEIQRIVRTVLVIALVAGSLLILFAARYIVNPLRLLTAATRRMAKGQFNVELPTKRRDELGQLAESFNHMARELAKTDRMRQEFVTNVSHEIQSPLTSIAGFTRALREKPMSEESRLRYLTVIGEESERLSRLSRNLLRLARLQQESRPLHVGPFRLDEQLRRVVIALEPQWSAKRLALDIRLPEIVIEADEDQLSQVWTNLLGNAVKFAPEDGAVRLEASLAEDGASVAVVVADSGPGIPEEERDDIFKPFHKVDKSRAGSAGGSGLGLAIAKQIVDIHHGDIAAAGGRDSDEGHGGSDGNGGHGEPGGSAGDGGAVFTVRLPCRYVPGRESGLGEL